ESEAADLTTFVNHLAAIRDIREGILPMLILLYRTAPIERLLDTRRTLEARIPALAKVPWIVFADPAREPGCLEAIAARGELSGQIGNAPEWTPSDGRPLLLTPNIHRHVERDLAEQVRKLIRPSSLKSAQMVRSAPVATKPEPRPTVPDFPARKSA